MTSIMWFRRDLRISDNPAWAAATQRRQPICALFVLDPVPLATAGPLRHRLLLEHLAELDASLREHGGRLRIVAGTPAEALAAVAADIGADRIFLNADTTPYSQSRDRKVAALGLDIESYWGTLVQPPGSVLAKSGSVSKVFTPFWKTWEGVAWDRWPEALDDPEVFSDPGEGLPAAQGDSPEPGGERGALQRLAEFTEHVDRYLDERDLPAVEGTSGLSTDLRFGTISPRLVADHIGHATKGRAGFVRQLAWRDWYAHLLGEQPELRTQSMRPETGEIEWVNDETEFETWKDGRTGFPLVDAGMRQLAQTGRMHNRVRMVCASFLVKDLLIDWRWGEQWFRTQLIDADLSQNVGNWQWVAGTGPDAAPFFRVFNPLLQSRKFDAQGHYLRRWIPELAGLSARDIHEPCSVAPLDLAIADVYLGDTYPEPIVDHRWARDRALAAYGAARDRAVPSQDS